nr:Gfo/Idh/MocA family oxidoreductase [Paracoccus amoyensis]
MIGAFRSFGSDQVVSVLSSNAERGRAYATEHGIADAYADLDRMLADPALDAVYISTTNEKHFPQAMAAIRAGKHVLCEKPLAMNVADAVAMVHAAREAGLVFATNHHLRNAGSHQVIRDLVRAGRIGQVQSLRVFHAIYLRPQLQGWRIDNPMAGGGVVADIAVHDADTVRFHLDESPVDVVAMTAATGLGKGVEDNAMSIWRMPSGVQVFCHVSFTHPHAGSGLEIHGSDGSIIARNVMTQRPTGQVELRTKDGVEVVEFDPRNLYAHGVGMFREAVAGRGRPAADGEDGIRSLAVANAILAAGQTGQRMTVDYGGI